MHIGLIGCGNMGGGMGAQLLANGRSLTCYDPNPDTRAKMAELGADIAASPTALARVADIIILSLPKASVVDAVMRDMLPDIQDGAIVLDTSTSEPVTSQAMAKLGDAQGFSFVDGPVSGGPTAANSGTMTMLLGGSLDAIARLRPTLEILTAKTVTVGGSGAGHAAKIANNMLCAANLVLVGEAVRLGKAAGVDPEYLLEGINAGSGRSGVSEVNFPKWVLNDAFDSGFTMGLMRKDVGLALDLAKASDVDISGFSGIADIWLNASRDVPNSADFNEIVKFDGKEAQDV
ncbi:3-hydroxyisobutyrate dehydrogenase [Litoreibacter halocynthiae]|uniref:3-hydroxyisobutyrate dehydrogenase n=1 Tax=Litoreibacter halocynthiae TaxID=1242689 RepID=A0A4R7LPX6_9RHOB|nr:NAD(P)-dependent oxidoreductase [Litoreibacter halocynthiae]TDT76946.1 3-hydroxyisobutyrate dehydrogenase [Litoreibacter halocynthiae]